MDTTWATSGVLVGDVGPAGPDLTCYFAFKDTMRPLHVALVVALLATAAAYPASQAWGEHKRNAEAAERGLDLAEYKRLHPDYRVSDEPDAWELSEIRLRRRQGH